MLFGGSDDDKKHSSFSSFRDFRGPKFTLGGPVPPVRSLAEKFFVPEASTLLCLIEFLISTF